MLKQLRPLFPYLKRYRSGLFWGTVSVLMTNGIWILFPQVIRVAVNDLSAGITHHKLVVYSLLLVAHRAWQGHLPIFDALDCDWHFARY